MSQKVIVVGNSLAVTIPKESAKKLGLRGGSRVEVHVDERRNMLSFRPADSAVSRELFDWSKKFIDAYRPALKALADK